MSLSLKNGHSEIKWLMSSMLLLQILDSEPSLLESPGSLPLSPVQHLIYLILQVLTESENFTEIDLNLDGETFSRKLLGDTAASIILGKYLLNLKD